MAWPQTSQTSQTEVNNTTDTVYIYHTSVKDLLVNLEKSGFSQELFLDYFKWNSGGLMGFQEDLTDHTVFKVSAELVSWSYMGSESPLFNI